MTSKVRTAVLWYLFAPFAIICFTLFLVFGSIADGLAYLRGYRVVIDRSSYDFDASQTSKSLAVKLRSIGWAPVTVQGVRTSCGCIRANGFPATLQFGSVESFDFELTSSVGVEEKNLRVEFFTDVSNHPPLVVEFSAR